MTMDVIVAHHGFFHPEMIVVFAAALPVAWQLLRRSTSKEEV